MTYNSTSMDLKGFKQRRKKKNLDKEEYRGRTEENSLVPDFERYRVDEETVKLRSNRKK